MFGLSSQSSHSGGNALFCHFTQFWAFWALVGSHPLTSSVLVCAHSVFWIDVEKFLRQPLQQLCRVSFSVLSMSGSQKRETWGRRVTRCSDMVRGLHKMVSLQFNIGLFDRLNVSLSSSVRINYNSHLVVTITPHWIRFSPHINLLPLIHHIHLVETTIPFI